MKHIRPLVHLTLVLALVIGIVSLARAASPVFWRVSTQAGFLVGDVENLSVDVAGRVRLGPTSDTVYEGTMPIIWSMVADGQNGVWAGTGNQGQVLHVDAAGTARVVFDAPELEVHALASAGDGGVFAGTSPDGKVYRIRRDGSSEVAFDPEERYIWALSTGPDGALYVGTGEKGLIHRVTPDGQSSVFFDTKAKHVTSLAWTPGGHLVASTSGPGRVFDIDRTGPRGFVLLDVGDRETRGLRVAPGGAIYVAAQAGRSSKDDGGDSATPEPVPAPVPIASVSTDVTISAVVDVGAAAGAPAPTEKSSPAKGAVHRITPDGLSDVVWESTDDAPFALVEDGDRDVLVGTGNKGKIFRVPPDAGRPVLLTRVTSQQVTAFAQAGSQLYFATANPAKIYRLGRTPAAHGTYTSAAQDAGVGATWGTLQWHATVPTGSSLEFTTRSGNTPSPDDTWSPWSAPYKNAAGDAITSPRARYLQWRAVFDGKSATPELVSVTAAYLPRNIRPRVTSLTVHPPGVVFQKPFPTEPDLAGYESPTNDGKVPTTLSAQSGQQSAVSVLGRRLYQKSLQTFVWKADDDNSDRLVFDVLYRREGDVAWKTLKKDLAEALFTWDTTSVADGTYTVKVVASDSPSNAASQALTGERESAAFDVDNTPPTIQLGTVQRDRDKVKLTFTVRDTQSPMDRVELSLDANRWQLVFPADGLADSRDERYEVEVDAKDAASILVRATDAMNNAATTTAAIPARR
ncbi:MAG: hypothetical protein U0Q12_01460 [Vicinamibacterales bacterium]